MPTLAQPSRWLLLGGGPAVLGVSVPFLVAIARILRLIIGPRIHKAGAIELHCHVGGDIGKVEDKSVAVGFIGGVGVREGWTGGGVNDDFGDVVVGETSVPGAEISSASGGVGAARRIGRIGRRIIRHGRSLSGAKV